MSRNVAGTLRTVSINGIPYRVAFDGNLEKKLGKFTSEVIATNGDGMRKVETRVQSADLVLIANAAEQETLRQDSEDLEDLLFYYVDAAGNTYSCTGCFNIDTASTQENRVTIQITPTRVDDQGRAWVVQLA